MNILFAYNNPIVRNDGGVGRVTAVLAESFLEAGHKAYYLALRTGEPGLREGIEQYHLPSDELTSTENKTFYHSLQKRLSIDFVINQAGIFSDVVDFTCDNALPGVHVLTVHHNCIRCLQENYRNILSESRLGKLLRKLDIKPLWNLMLSRNRRRYAAYFQNTIAKSSRFVLLSSSYIGELRHFIGEWPQQKVVAVGNPASFPIRPVSHEAKENRVLFIGRLLQVQKQADLLIPVWERFSRLHPDWHLDIVGDGSYAPELRREIAARKISNVHLHGFQHPEPFLERAKILIMTSAFEGFPMVIPEAQSYGVVPIAFNSFASLRDLLGDFEAGVPVTPFSVEEFSLRMHTLAENDEARRIMAQKGFALVAKLSPSDLVAQWSKLFESLRKETEQIPAEHLA